MHSIRRSMTCEMSFNWAVAVGGFAIGLRNRLLLPGMNAEVELATSWCTNRITNCN